MKFQLRWDRLQATYTCGGNAACLVHSSLCGVCKNMGCSHGPSRYLERSQKYIPKVRTYVGAERVLYELINRCRVGVPSTYVSFAGGRKTTALCVIVKHSFKMFKPQRLFVSLPAQQSVSRKRNTYSETFKRTHPTATHPPTSLSLSASATPTLLLLPPFWLFSCPSRHLHLLRGTYPEEGTRNKLGTRLHFSNYEDLVRRTGDSSGESSAVQTVLDVYVTCWSMAGNAMGTVRT